MAEKQYGQNTWILLEAQQTVKFILKTNNKTIILWGDYIDEEEPIDLYRKPIDYAKICPYAKPQPILRIMPNEVIFFYATNRPKIKNWTLKGPGILIKPHWEILKIENHYNRN